MQGTTITPILTVCILLFAGACDSATGPPTVSDPPPTTQAVTATEAPPPPDSAEPRADAATHPGDDERSRLVAIESLLRPLWFGWYVAVAAKDPLALSETVALSRIHSDGIEAIEDSTLSFVATPDIAAYRFEVLDVLRDDEDCIVAALREDPRAFLEGGDVAERIGVFWPYRGRWFLATSWAADAPEFAWADDCELMVRDFA